MADPIITKIGDVSAYLDAVAHGFEGTRAEFGELLANSANYAQSAESAASAASASAATAATKAVEATTAATAAQTAKTQTEAAASQALTDIGTARSGAISAVQTEGATQTANATAQAQAAATSATTASTKASEASASATTATTKATEAAASATSAANAASAAQGVLESIPEDYSDLFEDVDQLKADLGELVYEKSFTVVSGSSNIFTCDFKAGETYIISTNVRQTGVRTLASDKSTTVDTIITEFAANTSVTFVPTADAYYLRVWGVNNGTVTVVCTLARVPVLEDTVRGQVATISNLVGNEDALSISLDDLDNGIMHIPARFVRGTIINADGSAYTEGYLYRIVTPEKIVLDHDVRIYGNANYRVSIAIFNGDGTLVEIANISTEYYIVYANTPFRVSVRKVTEDTTEVADIEELSRVPFFSSLINKRITTLEADRPVFYVGSSREYTTLKAITEYISENDIHNATVYVDAGTYNLTSEYGSEYLDAIPSGSNVGYGLHVGNNTHYIFAEGAKIVFNYQGNNLACADYFSPFNITGSVTLENANIAVQNARYCVHEDLPTSADSIPDNTTVKYINCRMTHNGRTLETTGAHSGYACIGGGCNKNTLSIFEGGKYENVSTTWIYPISYHNYNGTDKSRIVLHNVWMSRGIRLSQLSTHQSIVDVEISGCYMPNGIQKTDNTDTLFNVTQWNNIGIE